MKKIILLAVLSGIFFVRTYAQQTAQTGQLNFTHFTMPVKKVTKELESLTSKEFKNHPEYGVLPYNAPCKDCYELLQKRDKSHRYFVKEGSDGRQFYSQSAYGALNYYDAAGQLRTIDHRLSPTGQKGVYSASNQPFPVTINLRDKYVSILNAGKELQVNRNLSLSIKNIDGTITSMGEANWTDYTAGDDGVVIHNFYPGIDLELHLGNGNVESFYRINKPLNLKGASLIVHDNVQMPADLVFDYSYAYKNENSLYEGSLFLNNAGGIHYYLIGSPAAYDLNGRENDYIINLGYSIDPKTGFDLYVPISWMNDPSKSYPIIIDPLIQAISSLSASSITGSGYNANCFTGGCKYDLNVAVPPAAIIYDINPTFWFNAFGTCTIDSGAWDITLNACHSPNSPQTYHTCQIALPGRCQLTGLSCFNDVKSCLPATQCASYTLPFVLTFYRCTTPGTGCVFSCINVSPNVPWTMTVFGRTDSVQIQSIAQLHGDTVCSGINVTLTANDSFGVPPYNVTWNPGGAVGNSIDVIPTSDTTFTATLIDACGDTATDFIHLKVTDCTGIESYYMNRINIYPNPVEDQLMIQSLTNRTLFPVEKVEIYNVLGILTLPPILLHLEKGVATMDVSKLPAGIYFIRISDTTQGTVLKFVKE